MGESPMREEVLSKMSPTFSDNCSYLFTTPLVQFRFKEVLS